MGAEKRQKKEKIGPPAGREKQLPTGRASPKKEKLHSAIDFSEFMFFFF